MIYFFPKYTDVYNFADDTTSHACDKDLNSLINRLEHDSLHVIAGFELTTHEQIILKNHEA